MSHGGMTHCFKLSIFFSKQDITFSTWKYTEMLESYQK